MPQKRALLNQCLITGMTSSANYSPLLPHLTPLRPLSTLSLWRAACSSSQAMDCYFRLLCQPRLLYESLLWACWLLQLSSTTNIQLTVLFVCVILTACLCWYLAASENMGKSDCVCWNFSLHRISTEILGSICISSVTACLFQYVF